MRRPGHAGVGLVSLMALVVVGCGSAMDTRATTPVEVLRTGQHCPAPPDDAGAAVVALGDDGAARIRLSMGQRSTGGYRVAIADPSPVAITDGVAELRVSWQTPRAEDAVTQALTRPCVEVELPPAYDGARFVDQDGVERGLVERAGGSR